MSSNESTYEAGNAKVTYGVVITLGTLVLITVVLLSSLVCIRGRAMFSSSNRAVTNDNNADADARRGGIDAATLNSYPKIIYGQKTSVKCPPDLKWQSCCSICISDYNESDVLRLIPDCGHMFHLHCIDAWLSLHATCPVCRTSPLPSPMATPLPAHSQV